MHYRNLGNTGLKVSEIGLGGEWLERHNAEEVKAVIDTAADCGINILDCWMSEPEVRSKIGNAIQGSRDRWIIQGHVGSTWQGGQYVKSRDLTVVIPAFEDLLHRMHTDYIDLGMIHYVDSEKEFDELMNSPYIDYVHRLKKEGIIRHVGLSSHNPFVAQKAVLSGEIEMLLFSINPAFDMHPGTEVLEDLVGQYDESWSGIAPERAALYQLCFEKGIGITVMKGYGGGRLFNPSASPFGIALTPVQCLHYCLTRPAVSSVLVGYDTPEQVHEAVAYETASDAEKDYASTLAAAPKHAFSTGQCTYCGHCKPCPAGIDIAMSNKLYDLAAMQPEVPASLKAHYLELTPNAADCISCGGCESRCPFGVKVVEKMAATRKLFGL